MSSQEPGTAFHQPRTIEELGADPERAVDRTQVVPLLDFPSKVLVRVVDVAGRVYAFHMSPLQSHALSDDLLKGTADCMKKGKEAG